MSFLAPLFLLGALAIAGPLVFHLIRRTTREHTVFSSLMFLLPTPPRLTRRSRLEHWLLLLLRCLALALLAFGFARPFLKQASLNDSSGAPAKRLVLLIDASASMRRSGLWADMRAQAERTLRGVSPADQVAVFTFGREPQPLVSFAEWNATSAEARTALVAGRLAETNPGWAGTNLGAALISAAEALADTEGGKTTGPRQIVLLSDLQVGARLEALQSYEWPKGVELEVEVLKAHTHTNAGVQLLTESADADRQTAAAVRVRVSNAADSNREQFKVGWVRAPGGDLIGAPVDTYVPPGQSRIVSLPVAPASGAEAIALRGDDEDFDNTAFVIPPAQQKITVAYLGSENADDAQQPLFFLKRALPATPRLAVTIVAQSPAKELSAEALLAPLIVATEALPPTAAAALRERALAGKTILFAPKNAEAAASLAGLLGLERLPAEETKPASYAMLAEIDFQHPLFAAFADPRFSDFTKIHFWKYRRWEAAAIPGARILAKFDSGDPALLEISVGQGRVLALAAGWNPDDSQLAVSSKFVPLLFSLLERSGALVTQSPQSFVGDPLPWQGEGATPASVNPPDGRTLALAANATRFTETTQPGIYRITAGARTQAFAVNLDPAETRTAPLPIEELERLGAPLAHRRPEPEQAQLAARQALLQSGAAEGRQKLWRWFVVATLIVLFTESLLAGWTARKSAPAGQPATP